MANPERFSNVANLQGRDIASVVAALRKNGAKSSPDAILVGDRAGLVEWTNQAWTRITGLEVSETIGKPIGHFLRLAGIELELVDFVGRHFLEGRSCRIEFPFETPERREIRIHLEVQPIRDPNGESATFLAIASVLDDPRDGEPPVISGTAGDLPGPSRAASRPPVGSPSRQAADTRPEEAEDRIDLSTTTRLVLSHLAPRIGPRTEIDPCLESDLPRIEARADLLERLVSVLIENACQAIGPDWGTLTLLTGRTTGGRSHRSRVHPVTARLPESAARPSLFLEIHDSGGPLCADSQIGNPQNGSGGPPRAVALAEARRLACRLDASLHFQSTPGCGNQALVLFPILQVGPIREADFIDRPPPVA